MKRIMMRKKGWLAIVMAFCFLLAGCGSGSANTTVEEEKDSPTQTQTDAVGDSSTLEERKEKDAGFITGTDLLIDGGVIAAIRTGAYKLHG